MYTGQLKNRVQGFRNAHLWDWKGLLPRAKDLGMQADDPCLPHGHRDLLGCETEAVAAMRKFKLVYRPTKATHKG